MTPDTAMSRIHDGRRADSLRRRSRVIGAIDGAISVGREVSVSGIARAANVDRSFLYRHPDLLQRIHSAQSAPSTGIDGAVTVTRESLKADLANARHTITRMAAHTTQLELALSEAMGEQAWRESGLGAPTDIDTLQRRIVELEQAITLNDSLAESLAELDAARAANREMFTQVNGPVMNRCQAESSVCRQLIRHRKRNVEVDRLNDYRRVPLRASVLPATLSERDRQVSLC